MSSDVGRKKRKRDEEEETTRVGIGAAASSSSSSSKPAASESDDEDMSDARPAFGLGFKGTTAAGDSSSSSSSAATGGAGEGIGSKLLKLAGYSGVGGLGKHGTGISEPVAASTQISTAGLGFAGGVKRSSHEYEAFKVEVELKPLWLISGDSGAAAFPSESELSSWLQESPRDVSKLSDSAYCNEEIQTQLLQAKSAFDDVPSSLFRSARERSNPFERIKGEFFQNRAALKMAELDAMCGRIFTSPPAVRVARRRELVYVGDICAGPGGFSEFMLTVLKWRCVVAGFTLRDGASDFNTHKFNRNAPTQSFHAFYGKDGTGDITKTENIRDYKDKILKLSSGKGLHVVMGDGGFSVVGRENLQEYLSRQLVLCQFLTALTTLQKGGVFVCKLFDSFLPFTNDLLWIIRQSFTHFSICKPNQSRPANSERYVVAQGLKQAFGGSFADYLYRVNDKINDLKRGWKSQYSDIVNMDFSHRKTDDISRARDRKLLAGQSDKAQGFVSGGTMNEMADRGDGKDMFGRDIPSTKEEEIKDSASASPLTGEKDILRLVPAERIAADTDFVAYMTDRNESIARRQIFTLSRLLQYVEDPNLPPDDQEGVREQCLKFWGITQDPVPALPAIETLLPRKTQKQLEKLAQKRRREKEKEKEKRRRDKRRHRKSSSRHSRSRSDSRSRSRSRSRSSHSSSSSRSRSRSPSVTPPPSRSRSPSPSAFVPPKKGYVHFDPLWQVKHLDPTFPTNKQSIFWTNAITRRMIQYLIPDDISKSLQLLNLPNEQERAQLRLKASQNPNVPIDPRIAQLDNLGKSARSFYMFPIPSGGIRHTVWFSLTAMGHIDENGKPQPWDMEPRMLVPPDTILDVVWSNGMMYILDAYSLPTPSDLYLHKTRPRLLDRVELVELLIESCGEKRLKLVKPVPLMEWKKSSYAFEVDPEFDLYFVKDGVRPPSQLSYSWKAPAEDGDGMSYQQVNELVNYVIAKQAPIGPSSVPAR